MVQGNSLAIIIPAYKAAFLEACLASIAAQTNKNFHLYIGDDASPEALYQIIEEFEPLIPISYHRFEENLGSTSLTRQWERCIALSKNESYIWLFSDDDIMPADAVERFYLTLQQTKAIFSLYRFKLALIDKTGTVIYKNREIPEIETNLDFSLRHLGESFHSSVVEFIFKREAYNKFGGFVEFPLAWCSDDATWAKLSMDKGIYTIHGEPIYWRTFDSINISSSKLYSDEKFYSSIKYLEWLIIFYNSEFKLTHFKKAVFLYLKKVIQYMLFSKVTGNQYLRIFGFLKNHYGFIYAFISVNRLILFLYLFNPLLNLLANTKKYIYKR
jgi:glycosyltransferase involved in cell wall biosynthesis